MVLLGSASNREELGTLVADSPQFIRAAPPAELHQIDWGLALSVCGFVGMCLWRAIEGQLKTDDELQKIMIKTLLDERKLLIEFLMKKP
jgi:hypothetical protein